METEIRPLREEDRAALLDLHRRCERGGLHQPAPGPARWSWLHERSPGGSRVSVAARDGGVAAELGAVAVRTWIDAREARFACVVDARLTPELRRGLRHAAPFLATARAFAAGCGATPGDLVAYGHPDERTLRLFDEVLEAEVVRTETLLVRDAGQGSAAAPPEAAPIERFDEQARWLYERCAGEWGASAIRDERWANWRFVDAPGRDYARLGVRDAQGILRGWAICADAVQGGRPALAIVDWLVPPGEPEVAESLLGAVLARARAGRRELVLALFPDWSPWFGRFQDRGFLVHPTDHVLMARNFDRRFDPQWLRAHWWYQLSDTLLA